MVLSTIAPQPCLCWFHQTIPYIFQRSLDNAAWKAILGIPQRAITSIVRGVRGSLIIIIGPGAMSTILPSWQQRWTQKSAPTQTLQEMVMMKHSSFLESLWILQGLMRNLPAQRGSGQSQWMASLRITARALREELEEFILDFPQPKRDCSSLETHCLIYS